MASASSRPRRGIVTALVVLASVILLFGIFAVWAKRQALDTNEWTNTSSELLQQETIRLSSNCRAERDSARRSLRSFRRTPVNS